MFPPASRAGDTRAARYGIEFFHRSLATGMIQGLRLPPFFPNASRCCGAEMSASQNINLDVIVVG
jgi:hypothetical protein